MRAADNATPDICVVNTCSVSQMADKKGRSLIRRIAHRWPDAKIIVTGCYAQLKPDEVAAIPGVDIVLGSDEKLRILSYIDRLIADAATKITAVAPMKEIRQFLPSCQRGDRTRWFLKVQDGCDHFCSYCTIPFARGRSRSPKIESLVAQAEDAAANGAKEIVITGVNIGDYGKGEAAGATFFDLIRSLDRVEGISRYRISSIEPELLTEEIIRWVANEARAFMPHFHIPLQSGSDAVLAIMRRRYDTALFARRIALIRSLIPNAFIGVDVIAGARGETPERWQQSLRFIESMPITRLHVFPYSERPGTLALRLNEHVVDIPERHRRVAILNQISDRSLARFMQQAVGTTAKVLWEAPAKTAHTDARTQPMMHGLTENYLRVAAPLQPHLINTITPVRIDAIHPSDPETLTAHIISHSI